MFGKSKNYILNTANLTDLDYEKVGKQATMSSTLAKTGVIVPNSIVLTTEAFEDFITAADLSERIATIAATVKSDQPESATAAAEDISALIMQASFPSLILNPLVQAYKSLSGFSDKYVTVEASWTLPVEILPDLRDRCVKVDVKGEAGLLYAVKQTWACLFSAEALLKRASENYQGSLSIAVLVQKMVQAEISGKAFSHDPITNDPSITVEALLGLDTGDNKSVEIVPDVYRVDKQDMRISEKNISTQEIMYLRKGRAKPDEEPNMQVAISPEWRRRQKLSDHLILDLAKLIDKLTQHYGYPLEAQWAFETGQIIIMSVTELKRFTPVEVDLQTQLDKAIQVETPLEILPVTPMLPPSTGKFGMRQIEKPVNIKSLAAEVEELVNNRDLAPEVTEEMEAEAEPIEAEEIPLVIDQLVKEHIDAEAKELKGDMSFVTNIYLDISDMSTEKLANAALFDGVYLDGTSTVLRHKLLAERITKDKQKLSSLIESYALEISTAAKVIEPKPIYYSFSDIGDKERTKMLDGGTQEELNGCERFLITPEAMIAEVLALKRARSTYDAKNIKLILPRLRTTEELEDIKKILSSQNVRRSSVTQLLAEISVPSFMYELIDVKPAELDGLFINLPKLAKAITGRSEVLQRDYLTVVNAIRFMLAQNSGKNFSSLVRIPPERALLEDIMSLNVSSVVFSDIPDKSLLELIQALETNQLRPAPAKRGRKPKSL